MNRRGQAIIESILILALFVGVGTLVARQFKQNELFAQMVSAPWARLAGMMQNGVWMAPRPGAKLHPSQFERIVSMRGEPPR